MFPSEAALSLSPTAHRQVLDTMMTLPFSSLLTLLLCFLEKF